MTTNVAASFQYHAPASVEEACRLLGVEYFRRADVGSRRHGFIERLRAPLAQPRRLGVEAG